VNPSELSNSADARRVTVKVDVGSIVQNLAAARLCCPESKIFAVIKADAYGHGAVACADALAGARCDGLAVVYPGEALVLRDARIDLPILVLQGPHSADEARMLADKQLWAVIHDLSQLQILDKLTLPRTLKVWLKVDTGMGRMGLSLEQFAAVRTFVANHPHLQCIGVLSHLACADDASSPHTQIQINNFSHVEPDAASLEQGLSLANSAAILNLPQTSYDWVRPGIMLYGINPLSPLPPRVKLLPSMQVSAPLTALKLHGAGDGIGYGQCYHCPEAMPVGYAAIGYGDGLPRALSGGYVSLNGVSVPVIGRVSMDSIALDLRGVTSQVGDRVVIWGETNPVEKLAKVAGTIAYELLCNIRGRRSYVNRLHD